jgi:predicted RNA-binding Zn ribbon-like protein
VELDSYIDAGVIAAAALVNGLTSGYTLGRATADVDPLGAIRRVLAVDPPSLAKLKRRDAPGFIALAEQLRGVFADLDSGDVGAAAVRLNSLLARHPANPHLAKENGVWRLHHHPANAALLPMWTSICAEGLARMIGAQAAHRLGICKATNCDKVFVDTSKNASRQYCSITCQNRTKTASFRARRSAAD